MALKTYADGRLFGERFGAGPVRVVALHGWGRTRSDFDQVLDGLDAIALDLPGFGASPAPDDVLGAHGYAAVVAPVVEEIGVPVVLVGHSFGGRVAVALAADRPDLVRALVLAGVPLLHREDRPLRRPPLAYRAVRWAHRVGLVTDERLEREKRRRGSEDYRAATGVMRDILVRAVAETYEDELAAIGCPVRMVWGAADSDVPVAVAERAMALLGDASLEVVPDAGHHVQLRSPDRLRHAIESLL